MITVDTHAHVFSRACTVVRNARYQPQYEALLEDWMARWPQAGVTHGVLVQPSFLGTDNSYMLEQLRRKPGHLRAVIVTDPSISLVELREADAAGARGIRLNLLGSTDFRQFEEARWQTLFGRMMDLGWHLEVQCLGELWASLLAALGGTPVPLVVDHFGLPDPAAQGRCPGVEAIVRAAVQRRVYVKLSAPYRLRNAPMSHYASRYLAELGIDSLLWGSDWPWTNHEQERDYRACMEWLHEWLPSARMRASILHSTPFGLYGFCSG